MRKLMFSAFPVLLVLLTAVLLYSCGTENSARMHEPISLDLQAEANSPAEQQSVVEWPSSLPVDGLQPWEALDGGGRVASSINMQSQFVPGIERFQEAGNVGDYGEASSFASGSPGDEELSWAIYRIPMGAEQPGTIVADVNLRLTSGFAKSEYYIGVADYSANTWHWNGPFGVSHVRFTMPQASYTSSMGNLMLAVVAYDGADFDLVGLGVNAFDEDDFVAPPIPSAPVLTPVAGGVLAEWVPVVKDDLAGYRIYAGGWEAIDYIEGGTSAFIPAAEDVSITLSAVDVSGNESGQSDATIATPLTGEAPVVQLTATSASGRRGDIVALNASGADSYDWDIDGDGDWDITGDTTGTAFASTADIGIIRPALRAHEAGGGFWMGAVSLIIGGNSRPVVSVSANPQSGVSPLSVNFTITAEDDDGTIAEYAWDFDGDGVFDDNSAANPSPLPHDYLLSGTYNAKFRVTDNEGSWDVDTAAVSVLTRIPPIAVVSASPQIVFLGEDTESEVGVQLSAMGSYSPTGDILRYQFNPTGEGGTGWIDNGNVPVLATMYNKPGVYQAQLRVFDEADNYDTASIQVRVYRFGSTQISPNNGNDLGTWNSLCVHNGLPFVSYRDAAFNTIFGALAIDSTGAHWSQQVNLDAIALGDNDGANGSSSVSFGNDGIGTSFYNLTDGALLYTLQYSTGVMTMTVDDSSSADVGAFSSMINLSGLPAISYYDWVNARYLYIRAHDVTGSAWFTPTQIAGDAAVSSSLSYGGGVPLFAYQRLSDGALCFTHGTDMFGDSWSAPLVIDNSVTCGYVSLIWLAGRPAIAYYDSSNGDLRFICAADSNGDTWYPPVLVDTNGDVGQFCSLVFLPDLGVPCISYTSGAGELKAAVAAELLGNDWTPPVTVRKGVWDMCQFTSIADVEGLPGISYYNVSNGECYFAYPRIN